MRLILFFKLIRWKNLMLLAYVFYLIYFQLYPAFNISASLSVAQYLVLCLSIILITAAGYIINDIIDIAADEINKPDKLIVSKQITLEQAKIWYKTTNVIGIVLGVGLCLQVLKPSHSLIFIFSALLLYYYSKKLKSLPLIGNVVVSFLVAFGIICIPIFTISGYGTSPFDNQVMQLIIVLTFFAFLMTMAREIVKDIQDINGDKKLNMNTLPILIGRKRSQYLAAVICFLTMLFLIVIIQIQVETYRYTSLYLVCFTLLPLLYVGVKLTRLKTVKSLAFISALLKIIMFFGVTALLIISIENQ